MKRQRRQQRQWEWQSVLMIACSQAPVLSHHGRCSCCSCLALLVRSRCEHRRKHLARWRVAEASRSERIPALDVAAAVDLNFREQSGDGASAYRRRRRPRLASGIIGRIALVRMIIRSRI
jgi:hypothetical protein